MITSYDGYLNRIVQLLDGEDVSDTVLQSSTLHTIARMGELRIYRDVKARFNQKEFSSLTATNNKAPIPADLTKAVKVMVDGTVLEAVDEQYILDLNDNNVTGPCRYFAAAGSNFIFSPPLTDGTAITGRYQYPMTALKDDFNNPFFAAYEDLFIYAALLEAEPFYGSIADKMTLWANRYADIKRSVEYSEDNLAYNASTIKRRNSARVIR